jgi:hypothetical protein
MIVPVNASVAHRTYMKDTERRQKQLKADTILMRIDKILDEIEVEGERLEAGSPPEDLSELEEQLDHLRLELQQLMDESITPKYQLHD